MEGLVAYGVDSDDETSPRRRHSLESNPLRGSHSQPATTNSASPDSQSSQSRSRKDSDFFYDEEMPDDTADAEDDGNTEDGFREPAPPRGHADSDSDSPEIPCRMVKVSSTASLSAFERDTFEKEDARVEAAGDDHSRDVSAEPAPPVRQSMDEDDEEEIDRQLEECKDLLKVGGSEEGGSTPATPYNDSPREMEGPATPRAVEDEKLIVLPPAPDVPCDPEVEAKFAAMFERKSRGENYNKFFQTNKNFLNPSIYELFIEKYDIQEFGSNFPVERYDPAGFPAETFYDVIAKRQNDAVAKANAAAAKKAGGDHSAAKKAKV